MENNDIIKNGVEPTAGVDAPPIPDIDYKALYEKQQKENANLSKYNKDLKEKYQAKMTAEEQQKLIAEEKDAYTKKLEKELNFTKIKTKLSARVNDETTLEEVASKLVDNDVFSALDILNKFESEREQNLRKAIEQDLLAKNPQPKPESNDVGTVTHEEFSKMGYSQRVELKNKKPEIYNKLIKK